MIHTKQKRKENIISDFSLFVLAYGVCVAFMAKWSRWSVYYNMYLSIKNSSSRTAALATAYLFLSFSLTHACMKTYRYPYFVYHGVFDGLKVRID